MNSYVNVSKNMCTTCDSEKNLCNYKLYFEKLYRQKDPNNKIFNHTHGCKCVVNPKFKKYMDGYKPGKTYGKDNNMPCHQLKFKHKRCDFEKHKYRFV